MLQGLQKAAAAAAAAGGGGGAAALLAAQQQQVRGLGLSSTVAAMSTWSTCCIV
jgi:hypothetical protein